MCDAYEAPHSYVLAGAKKNSISKTQLPFEAQKNRLHLLETVLFISTKTNCFLIS